MNLLVIRSSQSLQMLVLLLQTFWQGTVINIRDFIKQVDSL